MRLLPFAVLLACCATLRAEPVPPIPAPSWTLPDVNGKNISSSEFKGKVVVVDFWATWCEPCRSEIPGYERLQVKYRDKGLVIIGMDWGLNDVGPDGVKKFMKDHGMNYQVLIADQAVATAFGGSEGIGGIPTTFIINRSGMIVDRKDGAMPTAQYEQEILKVLNSP